MDRRTIGKNVLKALPLWCFLHDPVAMWIALRKLDSEDANIFESAEVRAETDPGQGRGHLYDARVRDTIVNLGSDAAEEGSRRAGYPVKLLRALPFQRTTETEPPVASIGDALIEALKKAIGLDS